MVSSFLLLSDHTRDTVNIDGRCTNLPKGSGPEQNAFKAYCGGQAKGLPEEADRDENIQTHYH